jgi:uncharacterized protein (TIGR00255 family)
MFLSIASMTGFARAEGHDGSLRWAWELKSVNGRNLDVRSRLPLGFEELEPPARQAVADKCKRGNVAVTLTVSRDQTAGRVRINRELLDQLVALAGDYQGRAELAKPSLDGLLAVRGVVEPAEEEELAEEARTARLAAMSATLRQAIGGLLAARREEGGRLARLIDGQVAEIDRLRAAAAETAAAQPAALKARLKAQVDALLEASAGFAEDRLVQEVALLVTKIDVREELDRLAAHVAAARKLMAEGGAIGRRFDFLCQEFNREANTLCSKAADVELTGIGLDMKAVIDQLREQVQNIE